MRPCILVVNCATEIIMIKKTPPVNYLNNKDILKEIHKSKMSFCFLTDEKYFLPDIILNDIEDITKEYTVQHPVLDENGNPELTETGRERFTIEKRTIMQDAKENKASRIQSERYAAAMKLHDRADYKNKPKQKDFAIDIAEFDDEEIVFRVMTFDHIPLAPGRKKTIRNEGDSYEKVNFPPFKHYAYVDGKITEVARSHWKGDMETGEFCCTHGRLTNKLGTMMLKLVERYSHRGNWRGYTYVDEMRGQALVQLSQIGLQFNESKSNNPFAYYTAVVNNCFTRVLNIEKHNQKIRDDILIDEGHLPSYGRQLAHEAEMRNMREAAEAEDTNDI